MCKEQLQTSKAERNSVVTMLKTFSITDIGRRRQLNQDYVFTSLRPIGSLPNLFIVADGMGGHNAGDFASRYAVETIINDIRNNYESNPIRVIRHAIEKANRYIREQAETKEAYYGMGTTVVVATIVGAYLYVANVGDSRLYLMEEKLTQVTRDHSLVEEMVRIGEIDRQEARKHPDKNIITRAIGAADEIKIDFFDMKLKPGNMVLMCSDGLSNMLDDEEILEIMKSRQDIADRAEALVEAANDNGGRDNIAVVIIEPFADEVREC